MLLSFSFAGFCAGEGAGDKSYKGWLEEKGNRDEKPEGVAAISLQLDVLQL
jgi:hypothetical protein